MSSHPKERTAGWLYIEILTSSSASTPIRTPTPRRRSARRRAVLEHLTVPADPAGYRQLIDFGRRHDATLWAIEGTGSFGAGLTTALHACCERVVEVDRPATAGTSWRGGERRYRRCASGPAGARRCGPQRAAPPWREAIRVLLATRAQAVTFRTRAISALHALVTSAPDGLRERLRTLPLGQLLQTCAGLRDSARRGVEETATVLAMRSTARRALACEREAAELEVELDRLVRRLAPELLGQLGIGPVVAVRSSPPGPITDASAPRPLSPSSAVPRPSRRRRGPSPGTD
jgi:transposase